MTGGNGIGPLLSPQLPIRYFLDAPFLRVANPTQFGTPGRQASGRVGVSYLDQGAFLKHRRETRGGETRTFNLNCGGRWVGGWSRCCGGPPRRSHPSSRTSRAQGRSHTHESRGPSKEIRARVSPDVGRKTAPTTRGARDRWARLGGGGLATCVGSRRVWIAGGRLWSARWRDRGGRRGRRWKLSIRRGRGKRSHGVSP